MSHNEDIKAYAKEKGVYHYQIAHALNYSDNHYARILRFELSDDEKAVIYKAIDEISAGNTEYTTDDFNNIVLLKNRKKRIKTEYIGFAVTAPLKDAIFREAETKGLSASSLICSILIDHFTAEGNK